MKLYEIDSSISTLWDKIISQDGELTEEDAKALEDLETAQDDKLKAYGVIIRDTIAQINRIKAEKERLSKMEKSMQGKVDWLIKTLSNYMTFHDIQEFKSLEVNISFRTSKSLFIADNIKIAKKWQRVKTEVDRQAIKDYIANGGTIKGCSIVENRNIQIK